MTVAGPSRTVHGCARPGDAPAVRPSGLLLTLRVPGFVVLGSVLGTLAHALAGERAPEPRLLALGALVVLACALPARRRELPFAGVAALLALSQAALHAVLSLCRLPATSAGGALVHRWLCPGDLSSARWAGDPLLVVANPHAMPGATHLGAADAHGLLPGPLMAAAHLGAVLALAWWMRRGEAAAWAVVRRARATWPVLPRRARTGLPAAALWLPPVPAALAAPSRGLAPRALHRRGPPAALHA